MTNSERRVQRVRAALEPPGNARDDVRIMVDLARGSATTGSTARRGGGLERAALAGAQPRRHELRAARGARRHPVAVLLRGHARAAVPARAAVGASRCEGPPAPFHAVEDSPPTEALSTSSRCASPPAGGWTPSTPACRRAATRRRCGAARSSSCRRRTRRSSGVETGERVRVSSARGSVVAPVAHRAVAAAGARVHDAALPRRGGDQRADDQRDRPEVGHGGVQGHRDPRRPAAARRGRGVGRAAARRRSRPADGPRHPERAPDRDRARGGRRRSRPARVELGGSAAGQQARPARGPRRACRAGAASSAAARRCTRCSRASAGSAGARSTTSAGG